MTTKNENLIETLRGKINDFVTMANDINEIDIHLEDGWHIDTDVVLALLDLIKKLTEGEIIVQKALHKALGIDETTEAKKKTESEGAKWTPEEILRHCELGSDNVLRLPKVQFNKKNYAEAKKWIEEAGGSWQGGKTQGFTFPFDAKRVFEILHEGKRCNLAKDYQFFETPDELADWLVSLAGGVTASERILEPSAGRGAIVKAIVRSCPDANVDCYELMPENKEILSTISNAHIVGNDFNAPTEKVYDKIIANPPFSGNKDIDHVRRMYSLLSEGGTLAAIMSRHWMFGSEKKCAEFRDWLGEVKAEQFPIDSGVFKDSGTIVATVAVVIRK